jgi:hypothetical protein
MGLRTLYLRRSLSMVGRSSLAGRMLYDQFRAISDDCILGHAVLSATIADKSDPKLSDDIVAERLVRTMDANLIYAEGGLVLNPEEWRVHEPFARSFVR